MNPERWRQVSRLFHSAVALDRSERAAFLRDATADSDLRVEVEQLLDHCGSAQEFVARFPAPSVRAALRADGHPPTLTQGELVSGRFRIVSFLGAGGMGEVYEADDLLLHGHVALKTLPALMADDEAAIERLKREIALARRVTHPNVCRVFDVDQHEASSGGVITFFTMELLKGETLAERLRHRGRMTTSAAYPLVKQMAAALTAAHAAGVVHGDLKPGNVILVPNQDQSDRAVVTDFGLALRATTDSMATTTMTGGNPGGGTPDYMAPEQIELRRATYATDIYALGTVAYEMITGKLPFEADAPLDLALKKLRHPPRALHEHVSKLDPRWEAAIHRCLERDANARFKTPEEFSRALDRQTTTSTMRWALAFGAAALVALVVRLFIPVSETVLESPTTTATSSVTERSVVLLPFTDVNPTSDNLALGKGLAMVLTDQIRQALRLENVEHRLWFAPAAEAIDAELGTPLDAQRTLGVKVIVTGRLERKNGRTLLTLNLSDAAQAETATTGGQPSAPLPDGEVLLPSVAVRVAEALGVMLVPSTLQALAADGTGIAAAEESYLRGRGHLSGRLAALDSAINELQRAIQLDKRYALAHAALSEAYRLKYIATLDPSFIPRAHASVDEAIALNPSLGYARIIRGLVYHTTGQDERAIREFQLALKAEPWAENALRGLAEAYEVQGDLKSAEEKYQEQIRHYPHYWSAYEQFGSFLFRHARYSEAETNFLNGVQYAPDNVRAINNLAAVYIFTERFAAAEVELERGLRLGRPDFLLYNNLGWVHIFQSHFAEAVAPMEQAVRLPGSNSSHWGNLARVYRWAERRDQSKATYDTAIRRAREETRVNPRNSQSRANLAHLLAETGRRNEALAEIAATLHRAPKDTTVVFKSALVYELAGDRSAALKAVEAAARGGHAIVEIRRHPDLARLRQDPRYLQMMTAVAH